ncbi:MAG: peptidoglycan bridge formation protein FemAB, partial [Nitrosomonas sp.]|nr:peptidoglycan bridge formation protein FemAB [Nitrosomonas sp.]
MSDITVQNTDPLFVDGLPGISVLSEDKFQAWDEFIMACPEATFFHRAGWKQVIEQAFGHKTWFLYIE